VPDERVAERSSDRWEFGRLNFEARDKGFEIL